MTRLRIVRDGEFRDPVGARRDGWTWERVGAAVVIGLCWTLATLIAACALALLIRALR